MEGPAVLLSLSLLWPLMYVHASVWKEKKKIILICFLFNRVLELKYVKPSLFYNQDFCQPQKKNYHTFEKREQIVICGTHPRSLGGGGLNIKPASCFSGLGSKPFTNGEVPIPDATAALGKAQGTPKLTDIRGCCEQPVSFHVTDKGWGLFL